MVDWSLFSYSRNTKNIQLPPLPLSSMLLSRRSPLSSRDDFPLSPGLFSLPSLPVFGLSVFSFFSLCFSLFSLENLSFSLSLLFASADLSSFPVLLMSFDDFSLSSRGLSFSDSLSLSGFFSSFVKKREKKVNHILETIDTRIPQNDMSHLGLLCHKHSNLHWD